MAEFEGAKALDAVKRAALPPRRHRRRQVPPRRRGAVRRPERRRPDAALPEPLPPRVRRPGRHRRRPRRPDRARRPAASTTTRRSPCRCCSTATRPSPARASSPRPSTCSRSRATPPAARSTHPGQPGRLHDRPEDGRSTPYAADMAKGFNVPIIHVNADDVEACIAAIRLAMAYREKFARDVVIDLIGYRRYGHNETDEPAYTQPEQAAQIKKHPPISELYAQQLIDEGVVTPDDVEADAERAPRRAQRHPQVSCARRSRPASSRTRPSPAAPASSTARRARRSRRRSRRSGSARSTRSSSSSRTASPSTASSASRSSAGSRSSRTDRSSSPTPRRSPSRRC